MSKIAADRQHWGRTLGRLGVDVEGLRTWSLDPTLHRRGMGEARGGDAHVGGLKSGRHLCRAHLRVRAARFARAEGQGSARRACGAGARIHDQNLRWHMMNRRTGVALWTLSALLTLGCKARTGDETSTAKAEGGTVGSPHETDTPGVAPEPTAQKRAAEQLQQKLAAARATNVDCSALAELDRAVCVELAQAVERGRTTPSGREDVQSYLRSHGLRRFSGFMIANVGDDLYEVSKLAYNDYFDISYPAGKHLLLQTVTTQFTSKGRFRLWARKVGEEEIRTKDGFTQTWDVYRESPLGELWQAVRKAPAGTPTSQAARALLVFLVFSSALERARGEPVRDDEAFKVLSSL